MAFDDSTMALVEQVRELYLTDPDLHNLTQVVRAIVSDEILDLGPGEQLVLGIAMAAHVVQDANLTMIGEMMGMTAPLSSPQEN